MNDEYAMAIDPEPAQPPPPPPPPPPPKKKMGCGVWAAIIAGAGFAALGLLIFVGLVIASVAGQSVETASQGGMAANLMERTVEGTGDLKILLVPITGLIADMPQDGLLSSRAGMVSTVTAMLKRAREDPDIRAVVLAIDSPGGGITASDVLYHEIMRFREETGLPVVALFGDVAASGGYYVGAAAEHIVAHPTSVTGSIGVVMPLFGAKGLLDKVGLEARPIKSGENKDLGSAFREMTPEERAMLQEIVDEYYERFVSIVRKGFETRGVPVDEPVLRGHCDGRIFTGRQALERGFVDALGYFQDARRAAEKRAGIRTGGSRVIVFAPRPTLLSTILAKAAAPRPDTVTLKIEGLTDSTAPRFMYLWHVGAPSLFSSFVGE